MPTTSPGVVVRVDLLRSPDLSPRIRVLLAVLAGSNTLRAIARATGLSLNTVSKWVNVLEASGLVKHSKSGYTITRDGRSELRRIAIALARMVAEEAEQDGG